MKITKTIEHTTTNIQSISCFIIRGITMLKITEAVTPNIDPKETYLVINTTIKNVSKVGMATSGA